MDITVGKMTLYTYHETDQKNYLFCIKVKPITLLSYQNWAHAPKIIIISWKFLHFLNNTTHVLYAIALLVVVNISIILLDS